MIQTENILLAPENFNIENVKILRRHSPADTFIDLIKVRSEW